MQFLMKNVSLVIIVVLSLCYLIILNDEIGAPISIRTIITAKPATIWDSLNNDFQLDHRTQSPDVQTEIRKLLAEQNRLNKILQAAGPYIYYIYQQTQERGLPAELALIPVIESEFNPNDASSKKGARGLWQLMAGTASELGIKKTNGYDGRRNIIDSTNAALAYFNDLGNLFDNNWYLAIAAYDCGQGTVRSAIRHAGSRSFWNLHLPKETRQYVPKLLAVAAIVENPKKYGVDLPHINNEPYFSELKIKKPVSLTKVSKSSGIDIKTLNNLNPGGVAPKKGTYTLLVPVKKEPVVRAQLANSVV